MTPGVTDDLRNITRVLHVRTSKPKKASARTQRRAIRAGIAALHRYSASRPVWWRWTCFLAVALPASPKQYTESAK